MMPVETRGSEWRSSLHIKLTRLAWELDLRVGRNDSQAGLRGDVCHFLRCGNQRRNEFFRGQAGREIGEAQKSCSGHVWDHWITEAAVPSRCDRRVTERISCSKLETPVWEPLVYG